MTSTSPIYTETIDYLFRLQRVGIKLGLDNIRTLLAEIGNPHRQFPAIHIAGTNGKGSTAAVLASILQEQGYKVGIFTSPHLMDFCERIRVNQSMIARKQVINFTKRLRPLIDATTPSFFEVNTAMAFDEFARRKVDIAVIETGMGGRLDSTNVVQSIVTIITPIDFDHQYYLGNSLKAIALEKAGIIKTGIPCVAAPQQHAALLSLAGQCKKKGSSLTICYDNKQYRVKSRSLAGTLFDLRTSKFDLNDLFLSLPGDYQLENACLALEALSKINHLFPVSDPAIRKGLSAVKWPGRVDLISDTPPVIVDVSHNPAGVSRALEVIRQHYPNTQIKAVIFLQDDKDYQAIGTLMAHQGISCYVIDLPFGKPLASEILAKQIIDAGGSARQTANLDAVFEMIRSEKSADCLWLFIGSHYLAGEVYSNWQ